MIGNYCITTSTYIITCNCDGLVRDVIPGVGEAIRREWEMQPPSRGQVLWKLGQLRAHLHGECTLHYHVGW